MKSFSGKVGNKFNKGFEFTMIIFGFGFIASPFLNKTSNFYSSLIVCLGVLIIILTVWSIIAAYRNEDIESFASFPTLCAYFFIISGLFFGIVNKKMDNQSMIPFYLYLACILFTAINKIFVKEEFLKCLIAGDASVYLKRDVIVSATVIGVYCIYLYIVTPFYLFMLKWAGPLLLVPSFILVFCLVSVAEDLVIAWYMRKKYFANANEE